MLIDEISAGETDTLEFKRDVPSDKLRLLKTACAFANCNGGRIVVGVDDDRSVIGVEEMSAFRLVDQLAFKYMNFIEEWGSGIPRIQELLQKAGLPPLHVENSGMDIRFTVWRSPSGTSDVKQSATPVTTEETTASREKTREKMPATREKTAVATEKTTSTREKIIIFLSENPSATQDVIATSIGLSVKGVEWNLKALKNSGRIRRVGPDKGGHWEVVKE